jgi:repressor LexA
MRVSDKQREMLAFIEEFMDEHGYPPTYEEIRVGLQISTKSLVNYHLEALESAGSITRSPNTPRGIRLTQENDVIRVPFNGTGPFAPPATLSELEAQEAIELTCDIVPNGQNLYAFKVQDDSLLDALVDKGDIVIMQPHTQARNGEMVAARLIEQGQTTIRRYYRENGHVRLQADNPTMEAIIVAPEKVQVQGKVVAVIRQVI